MRRLLLASALLLAGCSTLPAPPVDAARLAQDQRVLSADDMAGRAPGTEGSAKARAYILERFGQAGLKPLAGGWTRTFQFPARREPGRMLEGVNLIGHIPGRRSPERFIVVTAHYDHLGVRDGQIFNGADDNASGVAALIAMAERFAARRPDHSILFVALDAEEQGLQGARAFVNAPPVPKEAIVLNVNLDMVSRGDRGELYVAGAHPWPFLRPHLEAAAAGAPVTLKLGHDTPELPAEQNWITQSDHRAFHEAGIPFAYFGVEDHPDYHKPTDDFEKVPQDFFVRSVTTIARVIERFDRALDAIARERAAYTPPSAAGGSR